MLTKTTKRHPLELAVLVDDAHAHHAPSQDELDEWRRRQDEEKLNNIARATNAKDEIAMGMSMTAAALQKRRQREEKRAATAAAAAKILLDTTQAASANSEETGPTAKIIHPSNTTASTSVTTFDVSYTITIPTSSTDQAWYQSSSHTYDTLTVAKKADIWTYPSNPEERARCGVFRALWEKGFYMGCGVKFGGQYLVYPGT